MLFYKEFIDIATHTNTAQVALRQYCILLTVHGEELSLFHVFTFIPKRRLWLSAFTSFHSIHMQKFAKKLLLVRSNPRKT